MAQRYCSFPQCDQLVQRGRCQRHQRARQERYANRIEKPGDPFYSSTNWLRLRRRKLLSSPLCEHCKANGKLVPAKDVDHIEQRKLRPERAYDITNLQSLCKPCHTRKTVREAMRARRGR